MPKGDGSLEMVLKSLNILINKKEEWVSNETFKHEMNHYILSSKRNKSDQSEQLDGPLLIKKSEIARYFSFIEYDFKKKQKKITKAGIEFYNAQNNEERIKILFECLKNYELTFGRNNNAIQNSQSDLEVPILILKLLLSFENISKEEIAISIYLINNKNYTFLETLSTLFKIRTENSKEKYINEISKNNLRNKYFDLKVLVFYKELELVQESKNYYFFNKKYLNEDYKLLINNFYEIKNNNYENKRIYYKEKIKYKIENANFQKIIYGAPGTGKSHMLNKEVEEEFESANTERVTFYDSYTYGQFVGMYKPYTTENNEIIYKYVSGPFMRILVKALQNDSQNFCLIIEEINRAKADKVFGNIFQLLDRNNSGESQYPIALSEEQYNYLKNELKDNARVWETIEENGLYLPKNLCIRATMNSADDCVYPLDSAFKRRWRFKYIGLNDNENNFGTGETFKIGTYKEHDIIWNNFRHALNNKLKDRITEDKLIAPFFISPNDFKEQDKNGIREIETDIFIEKLLMYVFDDILRHYPKIKTEIFNSDIKNFSDISEKCKSNSIPLNEIFKNEFLDTIDIKENKQVQEMVEEEEIDDKK